MTTEEPTVNKYGDDEHPAFGFIDAARVTTTPGAVLFDSDIRHQHLVRITISTASRKRDLNRDWLHSGKRLVEIDMSEAQWASFVSSMNTSGVPCTLRRTESGGDLPGLPYAPRLAESMNEVRNAAEGSFGKILDAMAAYEMNKTAPNLRNLRAAINNATPNVVYAGKTLAEHAENVVQRSRADIEAMLVAHAGKLGIEQTSVDELLQLGSGHETD